MDTDENVRNAIGCIFWIACVILVLGFVLIVLLIWFGLRPTHQTIAAARFTALRPWRSVPVAAYKSSLVRFDPF